MTIGSGSELDEARERIRQENERWEQAEAVARLVIETPTSRYLSRKYYDDHQRKEIQADLLPLAMGVDNSGEPMYTRSIPLAGENTQYILTRERLAHVDLFIEQLKG